jgi:hypothetical protein
MKTLSKLAVNEDGFVFDPNTGNSFQVSPTGLVILHGLMAEKCDADIVEQLAIKYDVTIDNALRDLNDFRGQLKTSGLL